VGVLAFGAAMLGGLVQAPPTRADTNFTWTPAGVPDRSGAAMTFDQATGAAVLFGGREEGGALLKDTWTWDGTGWTPLTPAHTPPAQWGAAIAYDAATGTAVLFGGADEGDNYRGDTWTWDGTDWTHEAPAHSPSPRSGASMAYDAATGTIVLFGGAADGPPPYGVSFLSDTWTWDGTDWTHEAPAHSPSPRSDASMAYDSGHQQVLLFGGRDSNPGADCGDGCQDTWTWDGTDWTHETPATMPSPRADAGMAYNADAGNVVLFGGYDYSLHVCPCFLGDTWTWNGSDWTPQAPADSPSARASAAIAYDPVRKQVVLFGGVSGGGGGGDTWTWDGTSWTQLTLGNPRSRYNLAMAYDSDRQEIVLFGGTSDYDDTWTWDGAAWTPRTPTTSPPPRQNASMAYDSARQQVILFGGGPEDEPGLSDTWTWDGSDWTDASPAHHPAAREGASMVFDSARQEAVLFGGVSLSCASIYHYCGDTWTWDGTDWTKQSPADSPPARFEASMAYDPVRQRGVLFGGESPACSPNYCRDTWTWNGSTWNEQAPATSPPARHRAAMAYDPAGRQVVLFGGKDRNSVFRDTWAWDGSDWNEESPVTSPPARYGGGLAFDANGNGLLFGGYVRDPGPDSGSFAYGAKPVVVRLLGRSGGTVATKNANARHPLATSVTVGETEVGGMVSIAQLARSTHKAPAGYAFLPTQAVIAAPQGSLDSPLTLQFTLDASLIAGDPGATVYLFRTEFGHTPKQVPPCTSESPPSPNPCISSQTITPAGAVRFTVLTSSASHWNFALPGVNRSLSIAYRHHRVFKGRLSSSKHACVAGQKVTVFRKRPGPDRKIGADKTSSTGVYRVRDANAKGKYYASVSQHEEPSLGICEAAKSKVLRF
jgi:hypothetical protein